MKKAFFAKNRLNLAAFCVAIMLFLTSCTGVFADPKSLMTPPKVSGVLSGIEDALLDSLSGEQYSFVYPSAGSYRSACITQELSGDYSAEAVVFYELDSSGEIHINYLAKSGGKWSSISDMKLICTAVDRIDFADVCGGAEKELLIGCSLYNQSEKNLYIYSIENGELLQIAEENYTDFTVCSLVEDTKPQIMLYLFGTGLTASIKSSGGNTADVTVADKNATARLVSLNMNNSVNDISVLGSAKIDGSITSLSAVTQNVTSLGYAALYVDAYKGASMMCTEVLYYDKDKKRLVSALCDTTSGENTTANRRTLINCRDINKDERYEIPFDIIVPGFEKSETAGQLYFTKWRQYAGGKFVDISSGYYNMDEGYYLHIPDSWIENVTAKKDDENGLMRFYAYDRKTGKTGDELIRIKMFTKSAFSKDNGGYTKLTETDGRIVAGLVANEKNELSVNKDYLKKNVSIF